MAEPELESAPEPVVAPQVVRGVVLARLRRRAPFLLVAWVWALVVFAVVVLWWHPPIGVAAAMTLPLVAFGTAAVLLRPGRALFLTPLTTTRS